MLVLRPFSLPARDFSLCYLRPTFSNVVARSGIKHGGNRIRRARTPRIRGPQVPCRDRLAVDYRCHVAAADSNLPGLPAWTSWSAWPDTKGPLSRGNAMTTTGQQPGIGSQSQPEYSPP